MNPSPYTQPPTLQDVFCLQGGVMIAVENQYKLNERVQRAVNLRRLDKRLEPVPVESFEAFFNKIVVCGLVAYNPALVELSRSLGLTCPITEINYATLCHVLADHLRKLAEGLNCLPISDSMPQLAGVIDALIWIAAEMKLAAEEAAAETEQKANARDAAEKCEGCGQPATGRDTEGVPLCQACGTAAENAPELPPIDLPPQPPCGPEPTENS